MSREEGEGIVENWRRLKQMRSESCIFPTREYNNIKRIIIFACNKERWPMQDELILFRKMQEGDWCAFNSFFESYSERLYLYALGFVGNRAEAEDIVQDTFIYLWVNRAKITHSGSLYAYLSRSVKNSCIDRKLHAEVEQRYLREMMASGEGMLSSFSFSGFTPL